MTPTWNAALSDHSEICVQVWFEGSRRKQKVSSMNSWNGAHLRFSTNLKEHLPSMYPSPSPHNLPSPSRLQWIAESQIYTCRDSSTVSNFFLTTSYISLSTWPWRWDQLLADIQAVLVFRRGDLVILVWVVEAVEVKLVAELRNRDLATLSGHSLQRRKERRWLLADS